MVGFRVGASKKFVSIDSGRGVCLHVDSASAGTPASHFTKRSALSTSSISGSETSTNGASRRIGPRNPHGAESQMLTMKTLGLRRVTALAPLFFVALGALVLLAVVVRLIGWPWTLGLIAFAVFVRALYRAAARYEDSQIELAERREAARRAVDAESQRAKAKVRHIEMGVL